jgi:acetylornithine deacetylase
VGLRNDVERAACEWIAAREDELVELASRLIAFDTTAREREDPPREEAALQSYLGERLRAAGADVNIWEPSGAEVDRRQVPGEIGFEGRPQLAAEFEGAGDGSSLLFNGHIDAVSFEPRDRWTSDPLQPEIRDGNLYGRGACDMKGPVAAMVLAAEVLAATEAPLRGKLIVSTVTDEESSGAGALASVAHGVTADAGIVPESTGFDVWVACRGTLSPTITVPGRPGHAEIPQPHWRQGGAVNAIEKAGVVLESLRGLRERWRSDPAHKHPFTSPGDLVPTMIAGGEWGVSYPSKCEVGVEITFPPSAADRDGWGDGIRDEVIAAVADASGADDWLAENPATIAWTEECPAASVDPDSEIARVALTAAADVDRPGKLSGLDSWHDGATFTRAGTPCICLGPPTIEVAHTIDEHVPVADLVKTAQALALVAIRFRGVASD